MKVLKIISLFFLIVLTAGCSNQEDLEKLAKKENEQCLKDATFNNAIPLLSSDTTCKVIQDIKEDSSKISYVLTNDGGYIEYEKFLNALTDDKFVITSKNEDNKNVYSASLNNGTLYVHTMYVIPGGEFSQIEDYNIRISIYNFEV